ncbi:MAG: amino acid adenylation domain-containing protein [Colwellia sp.]|nr:amino acid adenylation domain-containing protein [Colwellia sp.]
MEETTNSEIAIIGMHCRFPGANNINEFWENLCNGVKSITFFTEQELISSGIDPSLIENPLYVGARGILNGVELFDAQFFGFTQKEAEMTDPQHRHFLETIWELLETSGYIVESSDRRIGVYCGSGMNTYLINNLCTDTNVVHPADYYRILIGNDKDFIPSKASYKLNLKGPSIHVSTACSSSLVAVHIACQSILNGECDMAVAGGVTIMVPQTKGYLYEEGGIPSPDGHCRAFDANAKGTAIGNGVGLVLLKDLKDALDDGDDIYAVIKGSAINNDGSEKVGYTAPSVSGQAEVIAEAQEVAGVDPETINYIEAHGTGTPLGDPMEIEALTRAFRARGVQKNGFCSIGSVKTNIGHLDTAAGVAGLIKTALCIKYNKIPPSLNFETPNPEIDFQNSPFYVNNTLTGWSPNNIKRIAGVSSFGIGGTNAHVIVEQGPERVLSKPSERPYQLFIISTKTEERLEIAHKNIQDFLQGNKELAPADAAFTLATARKEFDYRRIFTSKDILDSVNNSLFSGYYDNKKENHVIFMFPGQGAQYINMGLGIYKTEPVFREQLDLCAEILKPVMNIDIRNLIYPENRSHEDINLSKTAITQSVLFAIEYSLAKQWISWGVKPHAMIGHSIGEYVAATLSKVLSLGDALRLVAARGEMIQKLPGGDMVAVSLSEKEIEPLLENGLSIGSVNTPSLSVVSGPYQTMEKFTNKLDTMDVKYRVLNTSHAFHSEMIKPVVEEFLNLVKTIDLKPPQIPYVSNVTGEFITSEQATDPLYWSKHLRNTVRLADGLSIILRNTNNILLEVGPGRTMSTLALGNPERKEDHLILSSMPHPKDKRSDIEFLFSSLGRLWISGIKIDWEEFYSDEHRCIVPLPSYPFDRKPFWIEPPGRNKSKSVLSTQDDKPVRIKTDGNARLQSIVFNINNILNNIIGISKNIEQKTSFFDLGLDSLSLTQLNSKILDTFGIDIPFRNLVEELITIESLSNYLDKNLPENWGIEQTVIERNNTEDIDNKNAELMDIKLPDSVSDNSYIIEKIMAHQVYAASQTKTEIGLNAVSSVVSQQLSFFKNQDFSKVTIPGTNKIWKPAKTHRFKIETTKRDLDDTKKKFIDNLIQRYNKRTRASMEFAVKSRPILTNNRPLMGYMPEIKNICYTIIGDHSEGARFWDIDGNEYIDLAMGFGVHLFGHNPPFVTEAINNQLKQGMHIGPGSKTAKQVAELVNQLTGMERVAFCNTGTEAVLTAIKMVRGVTGRSRFAMFSGSYHGHGDETLITGEIVDGVPHSSPMTPGIPQNIADNALVLPYGNEKSLNIIKKHCHELAAVIVEPVQSRNPGRQPAEFLKKLRKLTIETDVPLFFDETITGFRTHPGGAQALFGIDADIAVYGKMVASGLPVGIVAGKSKFLNMIDGGQWSYEDDSFPEVETIFSGGTFRQNPLTMAASWAVLNHLKESGPKLQEELNKGTEALVNTLNKYFNSVDVPIRVDYFSSLFNFVMSGNISYLHRPIEMDLFYNLLIEKGIYIWEGRTCFLSTAHTDEDINKIINTVKESTEELRQAGFFSNNEIPDHRSQPKPQSKEAFPYFTDTTNIKKSMEESLKSYTPIVKEFSHAIPHMDKLCTAYIVKAFNDMGVNLKSGKCFTTEDLINSSGIIKEHNRLFYRLLEILEEDTIIKDSEGQWSIINNPDQIDYNELLSSAKNMSPSFVPELNLLANCGPHLAGVLRGEKHPLEVLFPEGNLDAATSMYKNSSWAVMMNDLVKHILSLLIRNIPEQVTLSILEIGGGTGSTTSGILPILPENKTEYLFTDISNRFLSAAIEEFKAYPFVSYDLLNIENGPEKQEMFYKYDLIIAVNVLHATRNLRESLVNIKKMLKPGGVVIIREATSIQRLQDLTFGLTDGWWRFIDHDIRQKGPLSSLDIWQKILEQTGFTKIEAIQPHGEATDNSPETIFIARSALHIPLTEAQKQLWLLTQMNRSGSLAYKFYISTELTGPFDMDSMVKSIKQVVAHHDALRTGISKDGESQVIIPGLTLDVPLIDISKHKDRQKALEALFNQENSTPSDLESPPLFRANVIKIDNQRHILNLTAHHIICDGWSINIILREILNLYREPDMEYGHSLQFKDFVEWQNKVHSNEKTAGDESYWSELLSGDIPVGKVPFGRQHPPVKTYQGARYVFELPQSTSNGLKSLSGKMGTTLFMTLFGIYSAFLSRLTGQDDQIIGVPVSGRTMEGSESIVGYCTHILPIRIKADGEVKFSEYMKKVKISILDAFDHQDYTYARLLNRLNLRHDPARSPLVNITFNLDKQFVLPDIGDLKVNLYPRTLNNVDFDIMFNVVDLDSKLILYCDYNTDILDHESMDRLLKHLHIFIEGIIDNPEDLIYRLPVLAEQERETIDKDTLYPLGYRKNQCIHQLFENQAAQKPDQIAIMYEGQHLTYRELNEKANQLAYYIRHLGIVPDDPVGICMDRSFDMLVSIIGILKAGGVYLPLDPTYPIERISFMLEDSKAGVLISQVSFKDNIASNLSGNKKIVFIDADWSDISKCSIENPDPITNADNVAYIIYTSGSTGKPKGVMVTHYNVTRLFAATDRWFKFNQDDVWTLFHSYAFDFSVWEIWGSLLYGGKLVVVPLHVSRSPETFYKLLSKEKITVLNQTPSAFRQLMQINDPSPLNLRYVIFGGEALDIQGLRPWFEKHGETRPELINMYGITETTVHVTYRPITMADMDKPGSLIGKPILDLMIRIMDKHRQPVPPGIPGEIYVGGEGVARGYLNRDEPNTERFITIPIDGEDIRFYKTGDLARILPDGDIEYLGRIDFQVKIRGFRIELGEIESLLRAYNKAVKDVLVLLRGKEDSEKRLDAYIVLNDPDQNKSIPAIRSYLQERLPEYMVPSSFTVIETIPLTPNGKVDTKALPVPDTERSDLEETYISPRTELECTIAKVWQEILKIDNPGINDNFFDLGGNSLLMVKVKNRLLEVSGHDMQVTDLFRHPTIKLLSEYMDNGTKKEESNLHNVQDRAEKQRAAMDRQRQTMKQRRSG